MSEVVERASPQLVDDLQMVRLGDYLNVIRGASPRPKGDPRYFGGDIPWISISDITREPGKYLSRTREFVTRAGAEKSRLLPAGTLILSNSGTVCVPKILRVDGCIHDGFVAFPDLPDSFDKNYLYWFFEYVRPSIIEANRQGITQVNLNTGIVREIRLPLTSIERQREIVAELEKQFSRLDEAVANLQRVKANLKRYKASVLKAAVEGRLVETEDDWTRAKLGDIALSVRNGYSSKPDADSGTRIFRISAVRPMELTVDDVRYLSGAPADYGTFLTEEGDVLFTRYNGSRDYVGVCAQVPTGLPPTVYPDKLIRVRVPTDQLLPAFLVISASTGEGREFIESMIRTTAGQSGVSGSDIKAIPLSIPTMAEQTRIVAEVDRHLSIIREVEAEVDANLQRAQALRQATLATAFGLNSTP